jgi:heptose-I-phosphate ethanolaminephosphotransferase
MQMKNIFKFITFFGLIICCVALGFYYLRLDNKRMLFESNKYILSKINDLKYEKKRVDSIYENSNTKKSIHVLVIGESASRNNHGIYGYVRNTTPHLSNIKNEIIAFNNVISSTPRTSTSLRRALTLFNNDKGHINDFSIVQMMNSADYETFWVSNQKPMEQIKGNIDKTNKNNYTNKIITTISNASDNKYFNFYNSLNDKVEEDIALLSVLDNILLKENDKKFIVIHLSGSHKPYVSKYPNSFNKTFDVLPNYKFLDKKVKIDFFN